MLRCKDVVYVKDNKRVIADVEIERVYLEYGPKDKVEKRTSKAKSKEKDGSTKEYSHEIEVPVGVELKDASGKVLGVVSVHEPNELFKDAIQYLQAKYTGFNPVWKHLELASGGENLAIRKPVHEEKRPKVVKAVTEEKATERIIAQLLAAGIAKDVEDARRKVAAMKAA